VLQFEGKCSEEEREKGCVGVAPCVRPERGRGTWCGETRWRRGGGSIGASYREVGDSATDIDSKPTEPGDADKVGDHVGERRVWYVNCWHVGRSGPVRKE
jgi:hypothetical protein